MMNHYNVCKNCPAQSAFCQEFRMPLGPDNESDDMLIQTQVIGIVIFLYIYSCWNICPV